MDFVQASSSPAIASFSAQPRFVPAVAKNIVSDAPKELPDITGMLIVLLVTLGLFVVPVGATLMQGPQIVAGFFGG